MRWNDCNAVARDPQSMSGAWMFAGTRVPVTALFENLEAGATIDEFVDWFPGVAREQALAVLRHAERSLLVAA
jgi:uncharacterized protein (DUF433 family)